MNHISSMHCDRSKSGKTRVVLNFLLARSLGLGIIIDGHRFHQKFVIISKSVHGVKDQIMWCIT